MDEINSEARAVAERFLIRRRSVILDPQDDHPSLEDDLNEWLASFARLIQHQSQVDGVNVNIRAFFSTDTQFNACATRVEGQDLIFLNLGLLIGMRRLINRLWSDPLYMPNCGTSQMEDCQRCKVERKGKFIYDQLQSPFIVPNCPLRRQLAEYAYNVAINFIFEHELAHIWHGHVDLMNEVQGVKSIDEVEEKPSIGVSLIDSQTFELDADSYAVQKLVIRAKSLRFFDQFRDISFERRYGENATFISIGLSTMTAFFSILEQAIHEAAPLSRKHPPAHIRANAIKSTAAVVARKQFNFFNEDAYEFCEQALVNGVLSFSRISQRSFDLVGYRKAQLREYQAYNNNLMANYAKLKPALNRAKRGGNLAEVKQQYQDIFDKAEAVFIRRQGVELGTESLSARQNSNDQLSFQKSNLSKRKKRRQKNRLC